MAKEKFIIEPHFRLQEWVAEEKGYFKDEGLDYVFQELVQSTDGAHHYKGDKVGRYAVVRARPQFGCELRLPLDRRGRGVEGQGPALCRRLFGRAVRRVRAARSRRSSGPRIWPASPSAVGYQSGSHYSTIQALEQYMPADKINLTFADGMLFHRLDQLVDGKTQASALFSGPYYFAEQLGFRKIIDTTFMIATMVTGDPDPEDLRKFFRALKRAQRDIDLRPDLYTHYYANEFPVRYHARMDTRRWGPGERLVFEPYTKEVYEETFKWIADHGIFADSGMGTGNYEELVIRAAH